MKNALLFGILAILVAFAFGHKQVHYKTEFISINATGTVMDYLNENGKYGWNLYNYTDYKDGRQYIFYK